MNFGNSNIYKQNNKFFLSFPSFAWHLIEDQGNCVCGASRRCLFPCYLGQLEPSASKEYKEEINFALFFLESSFQVIANFKKDCPFWKVSSGIISRQQWLWPLSSLWSQHCTQWQVMGKYPPKLSLPMVC